MFDWLIEKVLLSIKDDAEFEAHLAVAFPQDYDLDDWMVYEMDRGMAIAKGEVD